MSKNGYIELSRAVLNRAKKDYQDCLEVLKDDKEDKHSKSVIRSIESFFRLDTFCLHCSMAGYDEQVAMRNIREGRFEF